VTTMRHTCAVCAALQQTAIRRRDATLAEAAIRLRETHAANDAEREAFARSSATRCAPQQAPRSSMRMGVPGGNPR